MNRDEFLKIVAKKSGLEKMEIDIVLKTCFEALCDALRENEEVNFRDFGKFYVKTARERMCYNNFCNKKVLILSRNTPKFRAFKKFGEIIK